MVVGLMCNPWVEADDNSHLKIYIKKKYIYSICTLHSDHNSLLVYNLMTHLSWKKTQYYYAHTFYLRNNRLTFRERSMFFVWTKYVPKSYRKHILTWKMQTFNNLTIQFSTINFGKIWIKLTDFSCKTIFLLRVKKIMAPKKA